MKNLYKYTLLFALPLISSCNEASDEIVATTTPEQNTTEVPTQEEQYIENPDKIQVLNFATFHMGLTNDANSTDFDERNKKNQEEVHAIAKKLAEFKPTVILVETPPELDIKLLEQYNNYVDSPGMAFEHPSEIELLAYELGRLCATKRIYGIDHKMSYNYMIGSEIENEIDAVYHDAFYSDPLSYYPEVNINQDSLDLLSKLQLNNQDEYLNFLITVNADMLTNAGTKEGFEGADEATKYYQRNLRMFSNLNRIQLSKDDRVFILMGGSHTAFFRDFISRSPKYQMVNTFDYLK